MLGFTHARNHPDVHRGCHPRFSPRGAGMATAMNVRVVSGMSEAQHSAWPSTYLSGASSPEIHSLNRLPRRPIGVDDSSSSMYFSTSFGLTLSTNLRPSRRMNG